MIPCPPLPREDLDHVLLHTRELWEEARGGSFFITGGTGFFGMWLLESFCHVNDALALDMRATVLTRNPEAFAQKAPHLAARADLQFLRGDIRSFEFPSGEFPYIVHAATEVSLRTSDDAALETFTGMVEGMQRLLDLAGTSATRKFLLTSSGAVYGRQPSALAQIAEDYPGAPDPLISASAYGEGKRVCEFLGNRHAQRHGFAFKIARCFAFVGPHLPLDGPYAIGNFIRDALAGEPIVVRGDGLPARSYLYAADLAVWLWTMLFAGEAGRAYNVGSDQACTIGELAEIVSLVLKSPPGVQITQPPDSSQPTSRYVPSIERARAELALSPRVTLKDSLSRTAAWHRISIS